MKHDLIKREDVLNVLKLYGYLPLDSLYYTIEHDLPSVDRPQEWISCKERLPREYEVLCCDIYKNCIVGHPFADDSASTGFCAESEGEFLYECVAWMPLPEPFNADRKTEPQTERSE